MYISQNALKINLKKNCTILPLFVIITHFGYFFKSAFTEIRNNIKAQIIFLKKVLNTCNFCLLQQATASKKGFEYKICVKKHAFKSIFMCCKGKLSALDYNQTYKATESRRIFRIWKKWA